MHQDREARQVRQQDQYRPGPRERFDDVWGGGAEAGRGGDPHSPPPWIRLGSSPWTQGVRLPSLPLASLPTSDTKAPTRRLWAGQEG